MYATVDTRVDAWIDVHRRVEAGSIGFGETAFEMYPIDAPRVVFVGAVGMRCVGGQHNALVAANSLWLLIGQSEPTFSLHAIDEHELVDGRLALAVVVFGSRIIANIGDVKCIRERICLHLFNNVGREHQGSFAHKAVFQFYHYGVNYQISYNANLQYFFKLRSGEYRHLMDYFTKLIEKDVLVNTI